MQEVQTAVIEKRRGTLGSMEQFFDWMEEGVREGVKMAIETAVEDEYRVFIGVEHYERSEARNDRRNGYRFRDLLCRLGLIRDIRIPRARNGNFESRVVPRAQRKERKITSLVADMFLRGVSTRKVKTLSKRLWGKGISASVVSGMSKSLKGEFSGWLNRPIQRKIAYLILDAIDLSVRRSKASKEALLCAVGFTEKGEREFLGFLLGGRESTESREDFLLHLRRRAVDEETLKLITVDGNPGNLRAISLVFPGVEIQRCLVHKLWNVESKCPRTLKSVVGSEARRIRPAMNRKRGSVSGNGRNDGRVSSRRW
jgi:putative transposase